MAMALACEKQRMISGKDRAPISGPATMNEMAMHRHDINANANAEDGLLGYMAMNVE